ncbi:hypothetical protein [Anaerosporobacter faecicola]|uniref:hypothetical protein n=1 Tax=Anaerosporobacter faecicola TaxID=2718714 RepID=UPI001439EC1C|nr:hypothetical protein [Anaerosporobacter faecicola]
MNIGELGGTGILNNQAVQKGRKIYSQNATISFSGSNCQAASFHLKMNGLASAALPDGTNITAYKSESYSKNDPMIKVVTTREDGSVDTHNIDPRKVDASHATSEEMFALNAYLVVEGKLDNSIYETDVNQYSKSSSERKNFMEIMKEYMLMQYEANNISGYVKYNKIYSTYKALSDGKADN